MVTRLPVLLGAVALLLGCAAQRAAEGPEAPYLLVLGTAQDGGLPQIGCRDEPCARARTDPSRARLVTSLLLVDPASGARWLFDASPDLPAQVERARGHPSTRVESGRRPALFDGVFLTHAHMGHYTGLMHLGREAYGTKGLTTWASARMGAFLAGNGPWSLLVQDGALALEHLAPGERVELTDSLGVECFQVPHRDEYSDTLGFVVHGPERSIAYLPDIDKWERWERPLEGLLARVDLALVDGTFFDGGELPGRDMSSIPHPFVVETLARLEAAPAALRAKVVFTHLNHSNPLADPRSPQAEAVRRAGCSVAREGQRIEL